MSAITVQDILLVILGTILCAGMLKAVWISTIINDERKQRYRDGTHDYYGNRIEEDE